MTGQATHGVAAGDIARAAALLAAGELVALPTETVYGLGADAANPQAVAKIFAAKGRPADHPLIVHIASADQLDRWACDIPEAARKLAARFWPGPLTLILKRRPGVPDAVTGGQDTVGLRVPAHPVARALLAEFARIGSGGIAAPSANKFGRISPTRAEHVRAEFGDGGAVAMVLDGGECEVGIESTILDLSRGEPVLLRPGRIGVADIAAVIGAVPRLPAAGGEAVRASGTLEAHYAPRTPLRLVAGEELDAAVRSEIAQGHRIAVLVRRPAPFAHAALIWHEAGPGPDAYAHDLYAALRELDASGAQRLLVEAVPHDEAWAAVADRLRRAAAGAGVMGEAMADAGG